MSRLTDYEGCGTLRVLREFNDFDGKRFAEGQLVEFDFYSAAPQDASFTFSKDGETVMRLSAEVESDQDIIENPEKYFALPLPRLAWYTNLASLTVANGFVDLDGRVFQPGDPVLWAVHERDQSQLIHWFLGHSGTVMRLDEQNSDHVALLLYPERFFELPFDARPA